MFNGTRLELVSLEVGQKVTALSGHGGEEAVAYVMTVLQSGEWPTVSLVTHGPGDTVTEQTPVTLGGTAFPETVDVYGTEQAAYRLDQKALCTGGLIEVLDMNKPITERHHLGPECHTLSISG